MALRVGEAEVIIKANTAGFQESLKESTDPALSKLESDSGEAGALAGGNLRSGVKGEAEKLGGDLEKSGTEASGKLGGALEKGTSGIKSMLGDLGVPSQLLGGWAMGAEAIGGAAAATIDLASKLQNTDAQISATAGISMKAATNIGNAFLGTAGSTEYSGQQMATAFAGVAGQMKSVEGHALTTKQSLDFMKTASDLAAAKGIDLNTATATLASTMQAFQIPAKDAAKATSVLFHASNATGLGVDAVGQQLAKLKTRLGAMAPPLNQMGGLLVDMTNHGETGRAAMTSLSTAFTTLLKPAAAAAKAQNDLKVATDNLPPSLKGLAQEYVNGEISSKQLTKAGYGLSSSQALMFAQFKKAADAAKLQDVAQQTLGITVTKSNGQFVGMTQIMSQLHEKIKGMNKAQATAELTALGFGSSAARLVSTIQAGPAAFDAATASVSKQNDVQDAAATKAQTMEGQFNTLKSAALDFGTQIGEALMPILNEFMGLLNTLIPVIGTLLTAAFDILKPIIQAAIDVLKPLLKAVEDLINFVVDVFQGKWSAAWGAIKGVFVNLFKAIIADIHGYMATFGKIPMMILKALGDAGSVLVKWGWDLIKGLAEGIIKGAGEIGSAIFDAIKHGLASVKGIISHIPVVGGVLAHFFAEGGIVTKPTLAVIGEAGTEYVIPKSKLDQFSGSPSALPSLHSRSLAESGRPTGSTSHMVHMHVHSGAVVINPAHGNDAASLKATSELVSLAFQRLGDELVQGIAKTSMKVHA